MTVDITVPVTQQDLDKYGDIMSNWLKTHSYIKTLPQNEKTLHKLRVMMTVELRTRRRIQMITRLRSRFMALRKTLEDQAIFKKLPELAQV